MNILKTLFGLFIVLFAAIGLLALVLVTAVSINSSSNTIASQGDLMTPGVISRPSSGVVTQSLATRAPTTQSQPSNYYEYSRTDWGANLLWDNRLKVYAPASTTGGKPYIVNSPDLDTGKSYRLTVQPGQLIALPDPAQRPSGITIHDTATPFNPYCTLQQSKATLQSIQRYHALEAFGHIEYDQQAGRGDPRHELDNLGLVDSSSGDIGYHFLIDCAGRIFEGRAGGIFYEGQHVHRHNRGQIGIALIGSFDRQPPPPAQREALVKLLTKLCRDLAIDPAGVWQEPLLDSTTTKSLVKNGQPVLNIAGHRNFPDNDHSDPGLLDLALVRQVVKAKLA